MAFQSKTFTSECRLSSDFPLHYLGEKLFSSAKSFLDVVKIMFHLQGSFKSSIRRAPRNKRLSSKKRSKKNAVESSMGNQLTVSGQYHSQVERMPPPPLPPSTSSSSGSNITLSSTTPSPSSTSSVNLPSSVIESLQHSEQATSEQNEYGQNGSNSLHHHHGYNNFHQLYMKHNASETHPTTGRRHHRRHSHATVSSSHTASLLSADSKPFATSSASITPYLHQVHRSFVIKPIPSANSKPLLVFINPKSGGNQGAKLMQKFQWHLNPRQVFDLTQGGPRLGLDLYKKVHNLRILACGGDGTAGWVLSAIDEIAIQPPPPISVLPLGTGNDLARSFGWGGSYTDEPVSKILCNIQEGEVVQLDRWNLRVQRNEAAPILESESKGAKADLPLNVVNNYFSIGVDAHIALSFHEAREAHPERFNSRLRNKMFYGQAGGKDLLQRKWKDLCNYVRLECDGVDYTSRLRELKVHSVLFLNIPR